MCESRELVWMGSSRKQLRTFPEDVRDTVGYALYLAQVGDKHPDAKPLKGFGGAGVLEVTADDDGDTYRAVYTVTLPDAVYVLHAFQKKAKHGIATPKPVLDLIRQRLQEAKQLSAERIGHREAGTT